MKKATMFLAVCLMVLMLAACGDKEKETNDEDLLETEEESYSEFQWPDSDIAKLLPKPNSNIGRIEWEASYGFVIYVAETPKEQYDAYVEACKDNGFTVDYQAGDDFYYADNSDGYDLTLMYEGEDVMFVRIDEPDDMDSEAQNESPNGNESTDVDEPSDTDDTQTEQTTPSTGEDIDPEFKAAMDSYEAFFDEYCEFMKTYNSSDDTTSMLNDYTEYMTKYVEMMEQMEAIEDDDLSEAEALYYAEVTARISQKLMEVAQ